MILFVDENNRIVAYSKTKTVEQVKEQINNGTAVIYDGDFDFFMGEDRAGYYKEFYFENEIRIEYIEIPPLPELPEPTPQDIINANNTTMLLKISKALGV